MNGFYIFIAAASVRKRLLFVVQEKNTARVKFNSELFSLALCAAVSSLIFGCGMPGQEEPTGSSAAAESLLQYSSDVSDGLDGIDTSRPAGSVNLAAGRTVIVTILPDNHVSTWEKEELVYISYAQKKAAEYIMKEASDRGKQSEIITWDDDHLDLCYDMDYPQAMHDFDSYDSTRVREYLKTLPVKAIEDKYDTDSIGFLLVYDGKSAGISNAHYCENPDGYLEFINMRMYDAAYREDRSYGYEPVAAYAHEMLHLFGAVDLYPVGGSEAYGVTEDVTEYFEKNIPDEIMYQVYQEDGTSDHLEVSDHPMSDLTAALIGLEDGTKLKNQFSTFNFDHPGVSQEMIRYMEDSGLWN